MSFDLINELQQKNRELSASIKQLRKIINKEKYDIVHCHTPMGSVVTRFASKKVSIFSFSRGVIL